MYHDLTRGSITRSLLLFALPMMAGNLLQQLYNIADTLIVGHVLGSNALAAVGSAYTLMTFLTSIFLGLSMGSGALFSIYQGKGDTQKLKSAVLHAFVLILAVTVVLNVAVCLGIDWILHFLRVPGPVWDGIRTYLSIIFLGLVATSVYNFCACLLRAVGNSVVPLIFLAVSAVLNILLDLYFILQLNWGVAGAAEATVIAQYVSGIGIAIYAMLRCPEVRSAIRPSCLRRMRVREIASFSVLTCIQQSIMNLGILMVQGLVNSFGTITMAAFAAAVKIDAFAYMPVQDFGNAFSTFIAQNYGAKQDARIRAGLKSAVSISMLFCIVVSVLVCVFASPLMKIFVDAGETEIIREGVRYLRIEGVFYCGIGCLFLLYGLYRALAKPGMSVMLTVISLGTRVVLAYILSAIPAIGVVGIWWSVPIGWFLADVTGLVYFKLRKSELLTDSQ